MGGTILLADDSITIQKVVELTFSETPHRVVAVSSGRELLRRLPEVGPDIVLCDVVMPDLNGYEVCQTLKADPATLHIPLILLTGTFEPFDRDRALAAGCDAIVTKPFEGRELINVVEDLLRRAQTPKIAEPEPSFFPGLGVPEGVAGLEFTTTGFDQMVPEAPPEPGIPEHGIEMTGVGSQLPQATPQGEPGFEFGGPTTPLSAPATKAQPGADDSWIERIEADVPEVGPMQGDFFETQQTAPLAEQGAAEGAAAAEGEAPMLLEPWQESAELQARASETPFAAPVEPPVSAETPQPASGKLFAGASELPVPADEPAFAGFGTVPVWEEVAEIREEPAVGSWPAAPEALQPLNPARESIAAAWDVSEQAAGSVEESQPQTAEEFATPHPEPGFDLDGAPGGVAEPELPPLAPAEPTPVAVLAEGVAGAMPEPAEAPPELPIPQGGAEAEAPAAVESAAQQGEIPTTPEVAPAWALAAEVPAIEETAAETAPFPGTPVAPAESPVLEAPEPEPAPAAAVPAPEPASAFVEAPEPELQPPAEAAAPPLPPPVPVAAPLEPALAAPVPVEVLPLEQPPGEAPVPAEVPAAPPVGEELVERVAERVLARVSRPSVLELSEEQITAVAARAVQLIPPPPPPELPPLSYELEESDIQRIAARVVELLPPPPPPKLPEEEVEYVAQRAAQLLPAPAPELSDAEVNRVAERVLLALPEPPPPVLPESEIERVLERAKGLLPAAAPAAPAAAPGELSEAAAEQIARRALELATPILERIAWEVIPDIAEMLVRRRIEELEKETE